MEKSLSVEEIQRINEAVQNTRKFYNEMGQIFKVRKGDLSKRQVAKLLGCTEGVITVFVKNKFIKSDFIDDNHFFSLSLIEEFASDTSFLDSEGKLIGIKDRNSMFVIDENNRKLITPQIIWIDADGKETIDICPSKPPVRYVQKCTVDNIEHHHTMGVGWRAQDYHLVPRKEDIELIKKYNLDLGDYYNEYYDV
ncbi:MAG: hypothetical protein ACYDEX_08135 [Mobilitalea sp.]